MDRRDYIYASARIRVFEKKLLRKEQFQRLIQAGNEETFLHYLQDTDYGKHLVHIQRPEDFHRAMDEQWRYYLDEVLEMCPDPPVIEILSAKYVFHNYKVLIKERILAQDLSHLILAVPGVDAEGLRHILSREEKKDVPVFILEALQDYEEKHDAQRIDLILDKAYYALILEKALELEDPLLVNFVRNNLDYNNARSLIRLKAQGLDYDVLEEVILPGGHIEPEAYKRLFKEEPEVILERLGKLSPGSALTRAKRIYESTGTLAGVERLMDDDLMDDVREARKVTYGPEILFGFLLAKEKEIMNLRMIYTSLVADIAPEKIEERLRDSYV